MLDQIARRFQSIKPAVEYWSLRAVDRRARSLWVRQDILQPIRNTRSAGAMIFLVEDGAAAYAATSDLTTAGLSRAVDEARDMVRATAGRGLFDSALHARGGDSGRYRSPAGQDWRDTPLEDWIALLHGANRALNIHEAVVDWSASLSFDSTDTLYLNSDGARVEQETRYATPGLSAVAHRGAETQTRTYGYDRGRQGGAELILGLELEEEATRVADQALELLDAPDCPDERCDVLLMPDQMMLQIHESIGHPLELDRILGDERNYAGSSFVTLDMFGTYRYGSALLNVTFDPAEPGEFASYGYDDEGTPARREHLIRDGVLLRPLGGATSQRRAGLDGTANARACDWNRPAIDRMANLNLEPGSESLKDLIAHMERGVLMETNRSWSIDDLRNKFQFGCEYGRMIRDGEPGHVVRNPSYRGIAANFWRNLAGVGDRDSFEVLGVGTCGKGEPNQSIRVGHASPACLFRDVEVFGAN